MIPIDHTTGVDILVRPHEIEFWQGRPNRLHDRLRFGLSSDKQWTAQRLAP